MMNYLLSLRRLLPAAVATLTGLAIAQSSFAAVYLLDVGRDNGTDGNITPSPAPTGDFWNNLNSVFNVAQNTAANNLVTVTNAPSTISVTVTSPTDTFRGNGIQTGGLRNPNPALLGRLAVDTATQDFFFTTGNNGTGTNPGVPSTGTLRFSGLDPTMTYSLALFGSRATGEVRTTVYTVGTQTGTLQTSGPGSASTAGGNGNDDDVVTLSGLVPDGSNGFDLTITAGAGNFGYLGALQLTSTTVPEPASAALILGLGGVTLLRRRHA